MEDIIIRNGLIVDVENEKIANRRTAGPKITA